jgi:hypothetical protein
MNLKVPVIDGRTRGDHWVTDLDTGKRVGFMRVGEVEMAPEGRYMSLFKVRQ